MRPRRVFQLAALLLLAVPAAGIARPRPVSEPRFAPWLQSLPAVDRVEVSLLGPRLPRADVPQAAGAPKPFPIYPYAEFATVRSVKVVDGELAGRLAGLWRQQAFSSSGERPCHKPDWGLRFFAGEKVLLETSVSWECGNFYLPDRTDYRWHGMQTDTPAAHQLADLLTSFFPTPPYR